MGDEAMFVGIDVSKAELVVSVRGGDRLEAVQNDESGIRRLVQQLVGRSPELIVLEATGGYEMQAVAALAAADLPVVIVNPRQVRDFAKATGQFGQNRPH
jgi:transposase